MPSQRSSASTQNEKPEVAASKEELTVLEKLSQGLSTTISALVRERPTFDRGGAATDISIHEVRYSTLKGYQELAKHCYGRTVVGEEITGKGRPLAPFVYRITQANVGYIDGGCNVLARNSPIASKLVTANPGDESEVYAPRGLRFLTAREVRTFDGPTSLLSSTQKPNFRSMVFRLLGRKNSTTVQNIRAFVNTKEHIARDQEIDQQPPGVPDTDPTWLDEWQGISLGDSETSSLSHQFFTRTTSKQENALNNPRGLTFVEGIAGSGKTSIALGRLKFFANFSTGEERAHYGLRNAAVNDFSPTNMVGFVLSHSLKRYTAAFIDEVQDFREIEVLLMGMVVTDQYHQITLSGDRRQQLQAMGTDDLRNLFPFVPRSLRNQSVFLDRNFRQRKSLRSVSAGIRSLLQEDAEPVASPMKQQTAAVLHTFKSHAAMAQFILQRVITVDPYATVAVIVPSELEARLWYDLLREDLAAYHRPALLSHRDDLTRRNDIHFTEVREAKGLEFDVVIVPNLAAFELDSVIGRNQLYVAVSRPRHALLLGCEDRALASESLQKLRTHGIITKVPIQERSLN